MKEYKEQPTTNEQMKNFEENNSKEINDLKKDKYLRDDDLIRSEEIFMNIKNEIENTKKRNELFRDKKLMKTTNNNIHQNIIGNDINSKSSDLNQYNNKTQIKENQDNGTKDNNNNINQDEYINEIEEFSLTDDNNPFFEYSSLNFKDNKSDEQQQVSLKKNWKVLDKNYPFLYQISDNSSGYEYLELNKLSLRYIKEIDYDEMGLELKLNFKLIESSQILIFTRCFVNKDINDSEVFDDNSRNIEKKDMFNKYTSLIKIIKDMKTRRCNITFGTFYNDVYQNNKLCYKFFLKRQLIDYSELEKNDSNKSDDSESEFNAIINDLGDETITARISMNNSKKSNDVSGSFFLPLNKKAQLMICGVGQSVRIKDIKGKIFNKRNERIRNLIKFENENSTPKNCECCNIM